jgi:hypothetical protein
VGGHGQAGHVGDGGGLQPAGDTADPHQVRHDQVARLGPDGLAHGPRAVEVLPQHDGGGDVTGDPCVAVQVVVAERFLDPGQALAVERAAALQSLTQGEPLVVVGNQGDLVADRGADPADHLEVVGGAIPAHPDLQRGEAALGE